MIFLREILWLSRGRASFSMARYVPDSERNAFFKVFCRDKANKMCVDCGAPNPQWATAYFGERPPLVVQAALTRA